MEWFKKYQYPILCGVVGIILACFILSFGFFKTLIEGCLLSCIVEVIQLLTNVGSFDVDDIILNTLGVFLGYIAFVLCKIIIWRRE